MTYRCSGAGRWLPRVLGASLLVSALLVSYRVDPAGVSAYSRTFRAALVFCAAVGSLWLVRRGAETRIAVTPARDHLELSYAGRSARLAYADVDRIDFAPAFGPSRSWLPAMILIDREGRRWRIPALVTGGDGLVGEIVARAGRSDLGAWATARGLAGRMGRATLRVGVGYGLAVLLLAVAAGWSLG